MQAPEVIQRQNATAALRAQGQIPDGTTHLVHCYTGLNLRETLFAKGADEVAWFSAANVDKAIGNNVHVETL